MLTRSDYSIRNQSDLKQNNAKRLFETVRRRGTITKSDLARHHHLSFATVSKICNDLELVGLVSLEDSNQSSGGRRPVHVQLNSGARRALTVDLSKRGIARLALVDLSRQLGSIAETNVTVALFDELLALLHDRFTELLDVEHVAWSDVVAIGTAIPGVIDTRTGTATHSWIPYLDGVNIEKRLSDSWGIPAVAGNDANLSALALANDLGRHAPNILHLYFSDGVGLGIVNNGEIVLGTNGYAGEIGHLKVTDKAVTCYCGRRGCFSTVTVPEILGRIFGAKTVELSNENEERTLLGQLLEDAKVENSPAHKEIDWVIDTIGNTVGSLADIFDPDLIVISGNIVPLLNMASGALMQAARNRSSVSARSEFRILLNDDDETPLLRGCADHAFREWFRSAAFV